MDVYVSTVAGEPARSCTDAHADGSTLVSRKATISGFATDPTRAFLANATKSDRNHTITLRLFFPFDGQFHLMPDKFHFMPDEFHFMPDKFHLMPDPTDGFTSD
jgi:hypothetical protein